MKVENANNVPNPRLIKCQLNILLAAINGDSDTVCYNINDTNKKKLQRDGFIVKPGYKWHYGGDYVFVSWNQKNENIK